MVHDTRRPTPTWRTHPQVVLLSVGALVALVATLIVVDLRAVGARRAAFAWRAHTYDVMLVCKDLAAALSNAESGQRGYLLTGRPAYLAPFYEARRSVPRLVATLATMTRDNPAQATRVHDIDRASAAFLDRLAQRVSPAVRPGAEPSKLDVDHDLDKQAMDALRVRLEALTNAESRLLVLRSVTAANRDHAANLGAYGLSAAAVLLILITLALALAVARTGRRLAVTDAERRNAAAMTRERDFLQSIIEGSLDAIYVKDRQGRFVVANSATGAVYGVTGERLIGRTDADFASADMADAFRHFDEAVMRTGQGEVKEERAPGDDGERVFLSSKAPWRENGAVRGVIGISHDITELKTVQHDLQALNAQLEDRVEARSREIEAVQARIAHMQKIESLGHLSSGIAHDFNNMLSIVMAGTTLALRQLRTDPDKAARLILQAQEGAQRAADLAARLLAFAREQPLSPQRVEVNALLDGMCDLLRRTLGEQIRLETRFADGPAPVLADPSQLENAVLNLCVNARDAMGAGGRLEIETADVVVGPAGTGPGGSPLAAGDYVRISVRDTGAGMAPEVVARAFDPFYTTKGVGKGTGLGLSQVHGFIKQSGGHVDLTSAPGRGTTIDLYLPRFVGTGVGGPRFDGERSAVGDGLEGDEIILVVEDDAGVRAMIVEALSAYGYGAVAASDGRDALPVLAGGARIDLILTDIAMPHMDGRQLARQARQIRPALKVLFTSGHAGDADFAAGPPARFVAKPFTADRLAKAVRQALDQTGGAGGIGAESTARQTPSAVLD